MSTIKGSLTIVYEPPFYKAIFERRFNSTYEVSQINLGPSEPKLTLIYDLVIHHWNRIIFSNKLFVLRLFLNEKSILSVFKG
ncbi:DUF2992 family protein [Lactiplantibacillus plantarum]|uniref:DUF2992 family protein n=1 Tax=Lactiplantibacillus plantarum TaxID=1590 RepID=UPI00280B1730|nr:DUF2992 family protein [Lactiplantibacillus plantarum]